MDKEVMDKLMEIKKLYEADILTKEEMEREKAKILNPSTSQQSIGPKKEKQTEEIAQDAIPLATDALGHFIFDEPKESVSEIENPSESENSPLQEPKRNNGLARIATIILVIFVGFFLMYLVKNCDGDKTHSADDTYDVVEAVDTNTVDTDEDDTEIEAAETGAWDGRTVIEGGMYRNCYTIAFIDLVSDGNNNYHGTIKIQAGDGLNGCLEGDITANGSDTELTIHIIEPYVASGNNGNVFDEPEFYKPIQKNSDIFRIIKHGTNYSVQPLGNMSDYFDGIADETLVHKQ